MAVAEEDFARTTSWSGEANHCCHCYADDRGRWTVIIAETSIGVPKHKIFRQQARH